jgi:hypothetical protein
MTDLTPEQKFWGWFAAHEQELFHFDPMSVAQRERLFKQLAEAFANVNPDLSFEFGPCCEPREFVVSASGIKEAFPSVVALVNAAPNLPRWSLIAFRPRRGFATDVDIRGRRIHTDDVRFTLVDNGTVAGIRLFLPGYREDEVATKEIGYLLLDHMLGEFDVETRLGLITMHPLRAAELDSHSLSELPDLFDRLVSRLEGRTGQPS